MAERRRHGPYIWVTWLTKLLVGENSCEWASWFRAQHDGATWNRIPNSFDQTRWLMDHTAAVQMSRVDLEGHGYATFTEHQNSFVLSGKTATLGGKPDVVALKDGSGVIVDIKTGKPRASDVAQVMTYMYAVPRTLNLCKGVVFDGKVVYQDHEVEVPPEAVDRDFIASLVDLIHRLAEASPARRVPSVAECRFCEISREDCPDRAVAPAGQGGTTDDF